VVSYFLRYFSRLPPNKFLRIPPELSPVSIRLALLFLLLFAQGILNSGLTINCEDYFPRWQTQLFKIGQIQRNVSAPTRSGELRAGTCHQHRVGWGEVPTTEFPK
jgi:hypothetical protein